MVEQREITLKAAVLEAMFEEMRRDSSVFIMGEDVGAAGAGLSAKLRGTGQVAVCFFGDGALNQGVFFETMNIASVWHLPVIFVCENNLYGEFTASDTVTAGKHHTARGRVFKIPSREVDGMDVMEVFQGARAAVKRARSGKEPTFLVCNTYRFRGHHAGDQKQSYKKEQEEKKWLERDPISNFADWLITQNLADPTTISNIDRDVKKLILDGSESAQKSPEPEEDALFEDIYAE